MEEQLKIALIQTPLIWENPEKNMELFSKKIDSVSSNVDLIVLPEMFTTGFTMTPEHIAISHTEETVHWMQQMALKSKSAIIGSVVFSEDACYYNRLLFVKPDASISCYDKRHTFTLAGEHEKYTAGNKILVENYKGFKICPLICYDLRFPVWSRNTHDYDILLYVANWPKPRIAAWDTLLKARAIENMSYCVGVNRIGTDPNGLTYSGHSSVYDALGNQLIISEKEEILELTLVKSKLVQARKSLPFLEDRDTFNFLE